jgi:zinc/manganese transport system permease protein
MLAYPFMVHAFLAGAIVAVLAGAVGWFVVLRREAFVGHTLALVGFPGAAGAALLGASTQVGFFAACTAAALVLAAAPPVRGGGASSSLVGTVQAAGLALGLLFAARYHGSLSGTTALLFGSFLGVSAHQVVVLAIVGAAALAALLALGRPLLFASIDPAVAAARGVPPRLVRAGFLVVLGVAAASASQVVGSLLVIALLVLPPAAAQRLTARPARGVALAAALAVAVTWLGLAASWWSGWPIGTTVTSLALAAHLAAVAATRAR